MNRAVRLLDGLIEVGLVVLIVAAPIPYGSNVPWAVAGIEASAAVLVTFWMARMVVQGRVAVRRTPLLWPGVGFVVLVAAQLLRPEGTVSPYLTWESFRLLVSYLAILLVLQSHLVSRPRIVRFASALVIGGGVLAIFAVVRQAMAGSGAFLWLPASKGRLAGTFVNPNHEALCLAVFFFLALGLLLHPVRRNRGTTAPPTDRRLIAVIGLVGAVFAIGAAAMLTLSRGGFVSLALGILVVLAMSLHGRAGAAVPWAVIAVVGGFLVYAGWIGLDPLLARFATVSREPVADLRWVLWQATLQLAGEAPRLGAGLGAYLDAFARFRPLQAAPELVFDYAHNDYLQLLAESGVAGLAVLAWALIGLVAFVLYRWVGRRDPFVRGLTAGLLGALTAAAAHSVLDFGLHMPANALLLIAVLGLLPAVVTLRRHRTGDRVDLPEWERPLGRLGRASLAAASVGGLVAASLVTVPAAVAGWQVRQSDQALQGSGEVGGAPALRDLAAAYSALTVAARWEPWNPGVETRLARTSEEIGRRAVRFGVTPNGLRIPAAGRARVEASLPFFEVAYDAYVRSLRYRPRSVVTLDHLGWLVATLEGVRQSLGGAGAAMPAAGSLAPLLASQESLIPRARGLIEESVRWDPNNAWSHRSLGLLALLHEPGERGRQGASEAFRLTLALQPSLLPSIVDSLIARGADDELIRESVPRRYAIVLDLGRDLAGRRRFRPAAAVFEDALGLASGPAQETEVRLAYSRALRAGGDVNGALAQARSALVVNPNDPEVFATLSEVYEAGSQNGEAESSLASAIRLSAPDSPHLREHQIRLAFLLAARGQIDEAVALWRQALQARPGDAWGHLHLAGLLARRHDTPGALSEYRAAQTFAGKDWGLHQAVARGLLRDGHLTEAAQAYEAAISVDPSGGRETRTELADLYVRIGWLDRAAEQYRRVLAQVPGDEAARQGLARLGQRASIPGS